MTTNEFKPDWDEKLALTEEVIRLSKRIEELEVQPEPWEKFCDSSCVWTDHHPDCKLAQPAVTKSHKQEPVAWVGLDLDGMVEAFHRVIEEHHSRKNPFHDPVNGDAMLALRELRGLISYMKRNTTPPQRKPLTDEEIAETLTGYRLSDAIDITRAIEAAHGIKG